VVLVGRNPERLRQAALELDPVGTAAFDAADTDRLQEFFQDLPGPVDVAALAVHIMCNGALTGATYDIDGGQQLLPR
jgi:short-subunit dehydrogenase involved in D-alanine esterification of teichoic acids